MSIETGQLKERIGVLERELECYRASRVFWIFSVREAIKRGDVEAVRQNALHNEKWIANLQTEREGLRARVDIEREEFARIAEAEAGEEREDWTNQNAAKGAHFAAKRIAAAIRARTP